MALMTNPVFRTLDTLLQMKDAGLIAADAAAQVGGADKIVDVGGGEVRGDLVIDVTAVEVASNDELFLICLEGSSSATFTTIARLLAVLALGATEVLPGAEEIDSIIGRYIVPFSNVRNGTAWRYLRVYTDVTGTLATGINYSAFLAPGG